MFLPSTLIYLRDVHMTQLTMPTQGKGKNKKINACAIILVIEPFLIEQAGTIGDSLVESLFAGDNLLAKTGVRKLDWDIAPLTKGMFRVRFRLTPDVNVSSITLSSVHIYPTLKIVRDKDASVFKATLTMIFEADKNQLAYLARHYTGQLFADVDEEQPTLTEQD